MTEELLKKLHTAMCNDNEHQCNRLNNYIHTDEYLTAEVVQVVREIVAEETKELQEQIEELKGKYAYSAREADTYKQFCEQKDKQIEELEGQVTRAFEVLEGKRKRIEELEAQIEKMKCCYNCKHLLGMSGEHVCWDCKDFSKWQLKE